MIVDLIRGYCDYLGMNGYFNGSVLVSHKGRKIFSKGCGFADYSFDIKNTEETKFRIGSLTKAFTAMAILQLEAKGCISINDKLNKYIKDFPHGDKITLHQLLCHMSGIADFTSKPDYWFKTMRLPTSLEEMVAIIKTYPLEFEPGTRMEYTSSAYTILAYIVEQVSGLSYGDYLRENIFRPLGMENTGVDDGRAVIKNYAKGYTINKEIINTEFIDMSIANGGYGMYSTASDIYLWDKALYTEKLVDKAHLESMFTLHNELCGYDWFFDKEDINGKELKKWYHFGDVNGFVAYYLRYPEEELSVIVLSNFNLTPVDAIAHDIAGIVLKQKPVEVKEVALASIDDKIVASIMGTYEAAHKKLRIFTENKKLYVEIPKMYGVVYNYEIIPTEISNGTMKLRGSCINEAFIIDLSDGSLTYTDPYNTSTKYIKS